MVTIIPVIMAFNIVKTIGNFRFFVSDKLPKIGDTKQAIIANDNVP
jgi:hypothetical protein